MDEFEGFFSISLTWVGMGADVRERNTVRSVAEETYEEENESDPDAGMAGEQATGTSCTQSWMQLRVRLDRQLRNVCLIFRVLRLVAEALAAPPLDAPAPCACLLNSFC